MMAKWMILVYVVSIIFGSTTFVWSGWQLYDDFNSGSIDLNRWQIDDSSATITIDNGRVKFIHQKNFPGDSSWLIFKNPAGIHGIKATIYVESHEGDVRTRIAGFIGKIGDDYVWAAHEIRADRLHITSSLVELGPAPTYTYNYDYFWGRFYDMSTLVGQPFTLSMVVNRSQADYAVEGQGQLNFYFPSTLSPTDDRFKAIGTRSNSGEGACTVYFDDVYILKDSYLPSVNILLLE